MISQREHEPQRKARRGLTLVELLVTISIMATVTSMFVVAYRSAAVEANNIRTQSTIRKISEVLTARMQEYEQLPAEPLAIDPSVIPSATTGYRFRTTPIFGNVQPVGVVPPASQETAVMLLERARLFVLRQTIVQEMPDHPDDLKWTTTWFPPPPTPLPPLQRAQRVEQHIQSWLSNSHWFPTGLFVPGQPQIRAVGDLTSRTRQLIRKLSDVDSDGVISPILDWEKTNANAELLYLIVEDSALNGSSAIELFGRSEVRDTDGDGLNEFVDTYGNPIRWIRWPSGSEISVRSHPDLMDPALVGVNLQGDPLDRSKSDPEYASYSPKRNLLGLRPLVVSPGADRRFGLRLQLDTPIDIGPPFFPAAAKSFSLGDVPYGSPSTQIAETIRPSVQPIDPSIDLPYGAGSIDCYVADPWYPRNFVDQLVGTPNPSVSSPNNSFIPDTNDPYYHFLADQNDNISNLDTGGGAL
jgi:prepilin-type N-terminal cleavage/methylation domain-containing protein